MIGQVFVTTTSNIHLFEIILPALSGVNLQ